MADGPTNADGPNIATTPSPLFITKRYANMQEFQVPHDLYKKLRYGRESGDKWANYVEDQDLQSQIRNAYHKDGKFLVTCSLTGASCVVRKSLKQQKNNDDLAMSA